ncbi:glucosamine-6-phosphate deaminase [Halioxenophilus sp. WMMB6]|uniref:glucosamine-6-phosphate deaminase n=1 Tax=Halioxenophilus sp. WMMB6 TaxID=3073815 RepID=UPI00295E38B8|nr:glucosamine-6-phosphate deaminase [Halioxenophilus sp. WMMB6]
MEVFIFKDSQQVAEYAADMICNLLDFKSRAVLGLATGTTPIATYEVLINRFRAGQISFKRVTSFNLDEYIGLQSSSPHSYRSFMNKHLFDTIDIDPARTYLPECSPGQDPRSVGPDYEQRIVAAGGIDLQLLGIGGNGHIGFNEPGSSLGSRTRVKVLTQRTFEDNSRLFNEGDFQPHMAVTMGIATILDARRILLLATGEHKAAAIKDTVEGAISAMHPATVLQQHQRVRVILDEAAASQLEHLDYYQWVQLQNDSIAAKHGGSADEDPWFHN